MGEREKNSNYTMCFHYHMFHKQESSITFWKTIFFNYFIFSPKSLCLSLYSSHKWSRDIYEVKQYNLQDFILAFEIILILYILMRSVRKKRGETREEVRKFQAIYLNMKSHTEHKTYHL
jgi:hypothetical protein